MKNDPTIKDYRRRAYAEGVSRKDFNAHLYGAGIGVPVLMLASGFLILGIAMAIPADPYTKLMINLFALWVWVFKVCKPMINYADKTDPMTKQRKTKRTLYSAGSYRIKTIEGKPVIVDERNEVIA